MLAFVLANRGQISRFPVSHAQIVNLRAPSSTTYAFEIRLRKMRTGEEIARTSDTDPRSCGDRILPHPRAAAMQTDFYF